MHTNALAATRPERVAIYARISQDRSGVAAGVNDQLERARAYATLHGLDVVAVEHDNNVSAFRGKRRDGYERVLRLARARQIDAVVVYQLSRWTRNRIESAEFIEDFGSLGVNIHEAQGTTYQLDTATGRYFAGNMSLNNTLESELKSERVQAAVERRRKVGRHVSHPGYGWRSAGVTSAQRTYEIDPQAAAVVQQLARDVVAGKSLTSLVTKLNADGVPSPGTVSPTGKRHKQRKRIRGEWVVLDPDDPRYEPPKWSIASIKQLLSRPSNVGLLARYKTETDEHGHKRRVLLDTSPGSWPPILDEDLYNAALRRLDSGRGRGQSAARPGKRVHLLTGGIAYCGECGATMSATHRRTRRKDGTVAVVTVYRCARQLRNCTQRREDHLDTFARDALVARLSQPDALAWLMGDETEAVAAASELAELRQRQDDAAQAFAAGAITITQLATITRELGPLIEAAEDRRAAAAQSLDLTLLEQLAGPRALDNWGRLDVSQRRLALEAVGMRIEIGRSKRTGKPRDELDQSTVRLSFDGPA